MTQLAFPFSTPVARRQRLVDPTFSPALREQWSERFRKHYPDRPFRVSINRNTSTMISVKQRHGRLELSLHHMFIEAGDSVLAALGEYLRDRRKGAALLDRFIERNRNQIDRPRISPDRSYGKRYDLERIRDALGRAYFGGPVDVPIVWGVDRRLLRRRSIRLGSYSFEDGTIRIHPALDQDFVPPYVVVGVIYHEMVHHVVGAEQRGGRRMVHTLAFRERERAFVHYERAERWEKANLARLLRRSR